MTTELKKTDVLGKIYTNFTLKEKDKTLLDKCFVDDINIPRLNSVIDVMIQYMMQTEVLVAYVLFQSYKTNPEEAKALAEKYLNKDEKKLFETFIVVRDVREFSRSAEAENIRKMFIATCQDFRVVIVKLATILYDLKLIKAPMSA